MQRGALCRSRGELSNAYLLAKFGFDTAENEPCKVCRGAMLSPAQARLLLLLGVVGDDPTTALLAVGVRSREGLGPRGVVDPYGSCKSV